MAIKIVCEKCGSDDVTRDGLLRWSVPSQQWEASSELDNTTCEACGEDEIAKEVEIDETVPQGYRVYCLIDLWQMSNPNDDCVALFDTEIEAVLAAQEHAAASEG